MMAAVGGGGWGDLELLRWCLKLMLAKFISDNEIAPPFCSAKEGTSRLETQCFNGVFFL
jgi:hypothetical protein